MTVSIRASLIFSALGMAALTAAFATPPANKPDETAIAGCEDYQPELQLAPSTSVSTTRTERLLPVSLKEEKCPAMEQARGDNRESTPPGQQADSAGPS
jgi:hypothetical protein